MVGIREEEDLQSENLGKEVNATLHPKLGKNFLAKSGDCREGRDFARLHEGKPCSGTNAGHVRK